MNSVTLLPRPPKNGDNHAIDARAVNSKAARALYKKRAPIYPEGIEEIVSLVIPELQRRGLFQTEYQGSTLRENLGLPRPAHPGARRQATPRAAE